MVANDAGDRVTPAVVGYRDTEQVSHLDLLFIISILFTFLKLLPTESFLCLFWCSEAVSILLIPCGLFVCLQIVGIAAKQGQVRNAANTVVKVKQVLGRR